MGGADDLVVADVHEEVEQTLLKQGTGGAGRNFAKGLLHSAFRTGQRLKVDVLPRHFYSAIPDVRQLSSDESWRFASDLPGVRGTDLDEQLAEVAEWFRPDVRDQITRDDVYARAVRANEAAGFGPAEAQLLHAFVASRRPRRIVQIGAGVSTAVALHASDLNGADSRITCIDPMPTDYLVRLAESDRIDLIPQPAQSVPLDVFTSLSAGDLLFVDSTHAVKAGSEVNRIILEVLPRLARDVVIHFHDITFPYDYQRDLLDGALFFWAESTLLHAFLIGNSRVRILASGSMLQYGCSDGLRKVLPRFDPRAHDRGLDVKGDLRDFVSSTYLVVDAE